VEELASVKTLKESKLLVFTESKETADYLEKSLQEEYGDAVMAFSSHSHDSARTQIIENFDANLRQDKQKDDLRILITTDVLSEGVNLHRSNVVINYDIPWNPVRMMQRVGRVNRVSRNPPFDTIYTYNFFPAGPINENIGLKEAAESKIHAFIEMLGNDARLLTDEEIKSHDLFTKLTSKKMLTGEGEEDDPELEYLLMLRDIRDNRTELYERVKRLPKKARTARKVEEEGTSVITFFRRGKLRKTYQNTGTKIREVDFIEAARILEAEEDEKRKPLGKDFYKFLDENKQEFNKVFDEEDMPSSAGSRSAETKLRKIVKAIIKAPEMTDEDEDYLHEVLEVLQKGGVAKKTMTRVLKEVKDEIDPLKILARIRTGISSNVFQGTFAKSAADSSGPKEVILSEYLVGGN